VSRSDGLRRESVEKLAMLPVPPDGFQWPSPWEPLADPSAALEMGLCVNYLLAEEEGVAPTMEAELEREVCEGHPLYRLPCKAVAWNKEDPNEFLFVTADPDKPVAFVHLTWQIESTPAFPYTVEYPSWEAFRAAWEDSNAS
jgi:hypothetical protein